jgi:hypothetical protein
MGISTQTLSELERGVPYYDKKETEKPFYFCLKYDCEYVLLPRFM